MGGTKYNKISFINAKKLLAVFGFILIFFGGAKAASAATLYFSPSSGSYKVGQQFSVSIYVSSADQTMNAAEASISFSEDKLSVVSLSKSGIISLWAQEPSFSNSAGTVDFAGIVLSPGYTGSAGKVLTVTFKAKAEGEASLNFSTASVLANDGAGTNIFIGAEMALFNIGPAGAGEAPAPSAANVPAAPKIASETHPDSTKWYANNNPTFNWILTKDITGINVFGDHNPTTNPGTKSDGLRNSWTYKNVDDGAWYFHIRLKNSAGWGAISHFGFNIDTIPPAGPKLTIIASDDFDPKPFLKIESSDAVSGIDYYEISFDGKTEKWQDDGSGKYQFASLDPGEHKITVKVFDKAGNYSTGEVTHTVSALESPVMDVPERVAFGSKIPVSGTSKYSNIKFYAIIGRDGQTLLQSMIDTDGAGNFSSAIKNELVVGSYKVSGYLMNERGAKSAIVEKPFIIYAAWYTQALVFLMFNWPWIVILLLILFISFLIIWFFAHYMHRKKKVKKGLYINKLKLWGLLSELEKHIIALEKTRKKRRLEFYESALYLRFRKMKKTLTKYLVRRANGKKK